MKTLTKKLQELTFLFSEIDFEDYDIVEIFRIAKHIEKTNKLLLDKIFPELLDVVQVMPKDEMQSLGITYSKGAAKYDFSHISEWAKLNGEINNLTEKRKELESKVKNEPYIDPNTGEFYEQAKVLEYQKSKISIK